MKISDSLGLSVKRGIDVIPTRTQRRVWKKGGKNVGAQRMVKVLWGTVSSAWCGHRTHDLTVAMVTCTRSAQAWTLPSYYLLSLLWTRLTPAQWHFISHAPHPLGFLISGAHSVSHGCLEKGCYCNLVFHFLLGTILSPGNDLTLSQCL